MQINSYMTSNYSPVWKHMFKVPKWTHRTSCETQIFSNTVLINFESKFHSLFWYFYFWLWTYIFPAGSVYFRNLLQILLVILILNFIPPEKSLENQGIFRGNRSCLLIPLKLCLTLKANAGNPLIRRIQYFIGICIFVHGKFFFFL